MTGRTVVGLRDTTEGAVDMMGILEAETVAVVEGALEIWSAEAEGRTVSSRPPEAVTGTEASRVEACAEMLSEGVKWGALAKVTGGDMEEGAETVETGGEAAERVGPAIPVKDSRLWDPSLSAATESDTRLVSVMLPTESC